VELLIFRSGLEIAIFIFSFSLAVEEVLGGGEELDEGAGLAVERETQFFEHCFQVGDFNIYSNFLKQLCKFRAAKHIPELHLPPLNRLTNRLPILIQVIGNQHHLHPAYVWHIGHSRCGCQTSHCAHGSFVCAYGLLGIAMGFTYSVEHGFVVFC
jgi:hypothetical protein